MHSSLAQPRRKIDDVIVIPVDNTFCFPSVVCRSTSTTTSTPLAAVESIFNLIASKERASVPHNNRIINGYCLPVLPGIRAAFFSTLSAHHNDYVDVALLVRTQQLVLGVCVRLATFPTDSPPVLPTAAGSGGGGQPDNNPQSSAQLYLYTFLATLILLLGVSPVIVLRSLLLLRRRRRMVEAAIADGTWVPPAPRVKVDLRKKPRLWDAYLAPPIVPGARGAGESVEKDA
ncbi:hypothetical protein FB451DRAFT_1410195 [Mycena latifolia]|nr:hypothetical protein FB451DRAFT_1410195 [Mycena latifolia]